MHPAYPARPRPIETKLLGSRLGKLIGHGFPDTDFPAQIIGVGSFFAEKEPTPITRLKLNHERYPEEVAQGLHD
jgi:hypothetical protein